MNELVGPWQWPVEPFDIAVLALAPFVLIAIPALFAARRRVWLTALALGALALSAGYVHHYLRGGPRIIDATAYYLEGRFFAAGELALPLSTPESAILGRFLVPAPALDGVAGAAVIFPPGYPALLALGFRVSAPLAIGPLLAAALVVTTYLLGRRVARSLALPPEPVGAVAALFSLSCAALRYHTADTMSHGLAAWLVAGAAVAGESALERLCVAVAPRAPRSPSSSPWLPALAAGGALGWLAATRPATALALGCVLALAALLRLVAARVPLRRALAGFAVVGLGALPGLALYFVYQLRATGRLTGSAQLAYYALADGPPGCFGWGFGRDVGCVGEHGELVSHALPNGYGLVEALATTGRRLHLHAVDVLNFRPLVWLVPLGAWLGRRSAAVRVLFAAVLAHIALYAGFYFDGNYPGGGARMFADILPLEHVLAAVAVGALATRLERARPAWRARPLHALGGALVAALGLFGFAGHAGRLHAALRDREGGRPMFEPDVVRRAGVERGLVFVDGDHGFDLARAPEPGPIEYVRFRGDDLDWLTWRARGEPAAFHYRFEYPWNAPSATGRTEPQVDPLAFDATRRSLRIEAENLWPARAQRGGWLAPSWGASCARGQYLVLHHHDTRSEPARAEIALPSALAGAELTPVVVLGSDIVTPELARAASESAWRAHGSGRLRLVVNGRATHTWDELASSGAPRCETLAPTAVPRGAGEIRVELEGDVPIGLDAIEVRLPEP